MIWVLNPVWEYFNSKSVIRDETECEVICVCDFNTLLVIL